MELEGPPDKPYISWNVTALYFGGLFLKSGGKTTMSHHYIAIRIAKIQNTNTPKYWQGWREVGTPIHCWWESKIVQPL